jgi:uncharacterized protein (TIGR02996 family)
MTHEEAFIQAVCEDPDNEGLRLIYADWLEDHGDPRGEFIRVQCALARMSPDSPHRAELEAREQELLADHEAEWTHPLRGLVDSWEFCRGFVEKVLLTPGSFLSHAAALLRLAPVRHAHIYRRNDISLAEIFSLTQSPFLARLTTLRVNSDRGIRDDGVRVLAGVAYLANLSCLDLGDNWVRNEGAGFLASSVYLNNLSRLLLSRNPIGREGKQALRARFGDRVCF